jgi:cyanophycin synthetase
LKDPTVEFAVLETARGGILRSGLGFSLWYWVITNIQERIIQMTSDDLMRVKATVEKASRKMVGQF